MELLYSMRRKPIKCKPPHFENALDTEVVRPICTISTSNIIAFSSTTELSDSDGDTWGGHVYVCDLDTPWDSHKVTSTVYPVSSLEWDSEGKQLLVATTVGDISIFGQKDHLLNDWTCLYTATLPGEHIVKAIFFHNGRRVVAVDKKPDVMISEKFQILRSTPTLKGFGGVWSPGALVVTGSGLVAVITPPTEGTKATVTMESLRPARLRIASAAAAHKNGSIYVAYVCAQPGRAMVRAAACSARPLVVQSLPALQLTDAGPVSISWCLRVDTDSLLIAGTTLTLWKLAERSHPIHKLLFKGPVQGSTTPGSATKTASDCFNTLAWHQVALWPIEDCERAVQVVSNRAPLTAPLVVLASPRDLRLLARDTHHWICSRAVVTSGSGQAEVAAGAGTPPKKPKYGAGVLPSGCSSAMVCSVDVSALGGVAACVDSLAQLHVYALPPPPADLHASPLSIQHICTLLEYSMVTGYDCLDVLLTLKSNLVELVYDRFTETFQRQPQPFQQFYYHTWLKMRIALCRLSSSLASSASWLSCTQACGAAWAAAAAALRPDERAELAALLDDHHDQDKTLLALEAKPESCGDVSALQALRRPLQRALDIALTVLAGQQHQHHGYELISDPAAITTLRKLVVVSRASGRGGDALSRPLARLHAGPKHDTQEDCAQLLSQSGTRAWEVPPRCGVSAPHGKPYPLYLEYGVEPEALRYAPEPPAHLQCDITPSPAMDSIRYMYLGGDAGGAARWRACGRCGARALAAAHALQRAHDDRFLAACRCGGKWTLVTNV